MSSALTSSMSVGTDAYLVPLGSARLPQKTAESFAMSSSSWADKINSLSATTERAVISSAGKTLEAPFRRHQLRLAASESREISSKKSVRKLEGSVLSVSQNSVRCELEAPESSLEINLSPELFPTEAKFGMRFSLEMSDEDGLLQPVITVASDPQVDRAWLNRMESLLPDLR